jgi:hypothetical protein
VDVQGGIHLRAYGLRHRSDTCLPLWFELRGSIHYINYMTLHRGHKWRTYDAPRIDTPGTETPLAPTAAHPPRPLPAPVNHPAHPSPTRLSPVARV